MDSRRSLSLGLVFWVAWAVLATAAAPQARAQVAAPLVTLKPTTKSFSYKGAAGSLAVTVSWPGMPSTPVTITATPDAPWVVIDQALPLTLNTKATAKGTVKFHVLPCGASLDVARTAKIVVRALEPLLESEFLVSQTGAPCKLTVVPPTKATPTASGGGGGIGVTAPEGCGWTATWDAIKYPWLGIDSGASGDGSGTVAYSVDANWTGKPRSAKVLLATTQLKGASRKTYSIAQAKNLAVAPPAFSPPAGTYASPQTVVLSTATPGATIRYTTDGNTPTPTSGTVYASGQSVAVSATATLKAIAYKKGLQPSSVSFAAYTIAAEPEVLTARAGPDQKVVQGDVAALDGLASSGPEGIASYLWTQTGGQAVQLSDAAEAAPRFTAPEVGAEGEDLAFELTVEDADGNSSSDSVTIRVTPPTSARLIDEAVESGALTAEKGLTYKVFAVFGDDRLPTQYQGSEADLSSGTGIMMEVAQSYDTLSVEAKKEVYPFLLPAYVTNSWYDLARRAGRLGRVGRAGRAGRVSRTAGAIGAPVWRWVTNGKVKVWYDEDLEVTYADGTKAKFQELAEGVLQAVGGDIWGKLQDLMQKEPVSDAGVAQPPLPSPDYGYAPGNLDASGALDIVLAHGMNASGYTHPYKTTHPTPTFITIDAVMWPLGDEKTPGLIQIVAHELMHSWQFSYKKKDDPLSYYWVMEATAAWTEDYVYPDANSETRYAEWYLDTTRLPIDDQTNFRQYGLYTAFSFWTNGDHGGGAKAPPDMVRKVWENAETKTSIEAVDEASPLIPDGIPIPIPIPLPRWETSFFERFWMDSLVAAWNRGPDGYFFKKDKLTIGAKVAPNKTTAVSLGGADKVYFLDDLDGSGKLELPALTGRYYHFVFNEDSARTVMFYDGLRAKLDLLEAERETLVYAGEPVVPVGNPPVDPVEGAEWRMLTKIDGVWAEWRPPYAIPGQSLYYGMPGMVSFCRDAKAERLQELVVILGNSAPDKGIVVRPPATAPLLLVSNLGCFGWKGTITAKEQDPNGYRETTSATVEWGRVKEVLPQYDPMGVLPPGPFVLKSGLFNTQIGGQVGDCTYSGSDAWSGNAAMLAGAPDASLELMHEARSGGFYRTFDGHGSSGEHEVSYTVTCPDNPPSTATKKPMWWDPRAGAELPAVGADGTTIQGNSVIEDTTYEWNLHSVREP